MQKIEDWILEKENRDIHCNILEMQDLLGLVNQIQFLIFPGYLDPVDSKGYFYGCIDKIKEYLSKILKIIENLEDIQMDIDKIIDDFIHALPKIEKQIYMDIDAIYQGDPAAKSKKEIILCYPGVMAIFIYRIAHKLYELQLPILPRALSEYAHSKTGIDIHPGATIGDSFFIDHGTGIVIGETCIIGDHVKIYQGVTLGALSLKEGQELKGRKRHPTIEDHVTIYAGASILGGDTIIGKNSTIGSNVFITSSIEENTIVTLQGQRKIK